MKHLVALFAALLLAPWATLLAEDLPDGVRRNRPSELRIERAQIGESVVKRPMPQRSVDVNPPWLHVEVPLPDRPKSVRTREEWSRRFFFRLSQDPQLKRDVIESGPKRWSFFSPFRTLAKGTWFWTYGVAPAEAPDTPVWHNEVFSFVINGGEFAPPIPPTADEALAALKRRSAGPVAICLSDDTGHMLPDKVWPELSRKILADARNALKDGGRPVEINISDRDYPAHLGKSPKENYFMVKLRAMFTVEERRVDWLLRGYLLTGDEQFKKLGVQRAIELESQRLTRKYPILGKEVPLSAAAFYNTVPLLVLDAFYDDLPAEQQKTFTETILELMDKHHAGHPHLHDQLEHAHFNQHDWQGDVRNLILGSAILCRHRPELGEWFRYAYELWLYRSPALSRGDGGSMDGNGYLGVHDEPLTHVNWMLFRLTGFNHFSSKRWFSGFPVYMSYMNAVGNPGVPFSDGGDDSPGVPYLTEMLAHLCPDDPAHLWRFKTQGRRDAAEFSKDLVKGYKAMALLQLWQHVKAPDLSRARAPTESAAAFRDVGLAAMHSDLFDPSRNLLATFSSAVNGSFQHLHPSQNAFCVAYGGEPLFWRSGYYNGGPIHDALSYKCSRAHNTILVGGLVQGFDQGAYGWLPRFATGKRISYVLGDASQAYNGRFPKFGIDEPSQPRGEKSKNRDEFITRENGFGMPGVTRFRRHLVMLRPSHLLIYDELEAEKPVVWTFLLHSLKPMAQAGESWFTTANGKGTGGARLFCASPVKGSVTDQFFGHPVDEENKRGGKNPPNWHASISTAGKLSATRFITVIEVRPGSVKPVEPVAEGGERIRLVLGDYTVTAELDPAKPSHLVVRDRTQTSALACGQAAREISLGSEQRKAQAEGSTMLWEREPGNPEILREETDQLPPALLFGNRY